MYSEVKARRRRKMPPALRGILDGADMVIDNADSFTPKLGLVGAAGSAVDQNDLSDAINGLDAAIGSRSDVVSDRPLDVDDVLETVNRIADVADAVDDAETAEDVLDVLDWFF